MFAVSFYSAIASGQSVRAALDQARLAMDQLPTAQGKVIASLTREDLDLRDMVLVKVPNQD